MLAPCFDVMNFKPRALHRGNAVADIVEFATGENVFGDGPLLRPQAASKRRRLGGTARNGVIEKHAVFTQQAADFLHVDRDVLQADMLVHAD